MRLRKPCEHGRYDEHRALRPGGSPRRSPETSSQYFDCPGGEFLADDALVVETESIPDGGGSDHVGKYYPRWACVALEKLLRERGCYPPLGPSRPGFVGSEDILDALLAARPAFTVREGAETCGSFGCTLPKGHNMGKADIPANHALTVREGAG